MAGKDQSFSVQVLSFNHKFIPGNFNTFMNRPINSVFFLHQILFINIASYIGYKWKKFIHKSKNYPQHTKCIFLIKTLSFIRYYHIFI